VQVSGECIFNWVFWNFADFEIFAELVMQF
jgi:hypothetical protein